MSLPVRALSSDGTHAVYAAQPTPRNRDSFEVDLYAGRFQEQQRPPRVEAEQDTGEDQDAQHEQQLRAHKVLDSRGQRQFQHPRTAHGRPRRQSQF